MRLKSDHTATRAGGAPVQASVLAKRNEQARSAAASVADAADYAVDALQRRALLLDVLRERANSILARAAARTHRGAARPDNPFILAERQASAQTRASLDRFRVVRDAAQELAFQWLFGTGETK